MLIPSRKLKKTINGWGYEIYYTTIPYSYYKATFFLKCCFPHFCRERKLRSPIEKIWGIRYCGSYASSSVKSAFLLIPLYNKRQSHLQLPPFFHGIEKRLFIHVPSRIRIFFHKIFSRLSPLTSLFQIEEFDLFRP